MISANLVKVLQSSHPILIPCSVFHRMGTACGSYCWLRQRLFRIIVWQVLLLFYYNNDNMDKIIPLIICSYWVIFPLIISPQSLYQSRSMGGKFCEFLILLSIWLKPDTLKVIINYKFSVWCGQMKRGHKHLVEIPKVWESGFSASSQPLFLWVIFPTSILVLMTSSFYCYQGLGYCLLLVLLSFVPFCNHRLCLEMYRVFWVIL